MGTYISQSDLELQYGTENIAVWSNMSNDGTGANTARITQAIDFAETYLEARWRHTRWSVPFSNSAYVKYILCVYAAEYLYKIRGKRTIAETDVFDTQLQQVNKMINSIAAGGHRIDSALSHTSPTGMVVIE
jgi:hypothetical protein